MARLHSGHIGVFDFADIGRIKRQLTIKMLDDALARLVCSRGNHCFHVFNGLAILANEAFLFQALENFDEGIVLGLLFVSLFKSMLLLIKIINQPHLDPGSLLFLLSQCSLRFFKFNGLRVSLLLIFEEVRDSASLFF
jgi:hypothetical protein